MSFSRLLLVAANSKKRIRGEGKDEVRVSAKISIPGRDAYEGEVVLCFELDHPSDRDKVTRTLGIPDGQQRCDGLVFYAQDDKEDRVICLVEMKSTNTTGAKDQISSTQERIKTLLREECNCSLLSEECRSFSRKQIEHITWKACLYHHGASPHKHDDFDRDLKRLGFKETAYLSIADNDLRPLLTGQISAKDMAKKYKNPKGGNRR